MNEIINVIIAKADTVVKQSALILGKPDVPELIAIQALSILGKEKMALDIPVSTCKGMERFYSMFGTWRAGYSEQVKAIGHYYHRFFPIAPIQDFTCRYFVPRFAIAVCVVVSQYLFLAVDGVNQIYHLPKRLFPDACGDGCQRKIGLSAACWRFYDVQRVDFERGQVNQFR